jgi:DNA-binding CsgD family transcriptional regulator
MMVVTWPDTLYTTMIKSADCLNFELVKMMIKEKANMLLTAFYPDDSHCLVLDLDDIVIFVGKNRLAELGATTPEQLVGHKMQDILSMRRHSEGIDYFKDMSNIKQQACNNPFNPVKVIVSAPFENGRILHFTEIRSICDEHKLVIGCIIEAREFSLSRHETPDKKNLLSTRQEEIMFLLAIGFSQKEIAAIYGVHRGTIIKGIGVICDKFEIAGASTDKIIELVYEYGYGIPPYHLLKTGIFEVPAPFITTAFFRTLLLK